MHFSKKKPHDSCDSDIICWIAKNEKSCELWKNKIGEESERERKKKKIKQTNKQTIEPKTFGTNCTNYADKINTITIQTIRITYFDLFWWAPLAGLGLRISLVIILIEILVWNRWIGWFPFESFRLIKLSMESHTNATFLSSHQFDCNCNAPPCLSATLVNLHRLIPWFDIPKLIMIMMLNAVLISAAAPFHCTTCARLHVNT